MPPHRTKEARQLRKDAHALRRCLAPYDRWPRDARGWARRDRIDALLAQLEADPFGAPDDPTRFVRLVEELREWMAREQTFIREHPGARRPFVIPEDWTWREPVKRKNAAPPRVAVPLPGSPTLSPEQIDAILNKYGGIVEEGGALQRRARRAEATVKGGM